MSDLAKDIERALDEARVVVVKETGALDHPALGAIEAVYPLTDQMSTERDRYLRALHQIVEWDCLNPPDANLCADHPWLKRLVDGAIDGKGP